MKPYDDWKIGDKLRVILPREDNLHLGDIVTIIGFRNDSRGKDDIVIIDNPRSKQDSRWYFHRFEKVEHVYKPGDRVRIISDNCDKNGVKYPGGKIGRGIQIGKIIVLREYRAHEDIQKEEYSNDVKDWGAWRVMEENGDIHPWVYNDLAFELVEAKKEEEMIKKKEEAVFNPAKATRDQLREFAKLNQIPGRGAVSNVVALRALVRNWIDKDKPVPIKAEAPKKPSVGDELTKQVDAVGVGTCSYAFEMADGEYQYQVRDVCHARLPRYAHKVKRVVLNVKGHYDKHPHKEEYKKAVAYMIKHSPYAKAFDTKNIEDALREGVYLNVEEGCSRLAAAAIGLREFSEYSPRVKVFSDVCKMGFSEKTAHFASQWFQKPGEGSWKFAPPNGGHMSTMYNMNREHLFKFFKEGFFLDMQEKPMKVESHGYRVFQSIADSPNYRPKIKEQYPKDNQTMQEFFNKTIGTKVEGNPWAKPVEGLSLRQLYRALEVIEENTKG